MGAGFAGFLVMLRITARKPVRNEFFEGYPLKKFPQPPRMSLAVD
jgi:hypothetical protein